MTHENETRPSPASDPSTPGATPGRPEEPPAATARADRTSAERAGASSPIPSRTVSMLAVLALLQLAQCSIRGVVQDRISHRGEAVASVATGLPGKQTVAGPILVVRYTERLLATPGPDGEGARTRQHTLPVLPEALNVEGHLGHQTRRRGVFQVHAFAYEGTLKAALRVPTVDQLPRRWPAAEAELTLDAVEVQVAVADPRGLRAVSLSVAGQPVPLEAGSGNPAAPGGSHAFLPGGATLAGQSLALEVKLELVGTGVFAVLPLGRQVDATLTSDWPSPSFEGPYLPTRSEVHDGGFEASWRMEAIATPARSDWETSEGRTLDTDALAVTFVDPVDIYTLSDRATKYSVLFVLLTMGAFLLFEALRKLRMHPLNHLLVGAALLIFFLLLVSLSERIGFGRAYLVASVACVSLIGYYSAHLLRSAALAGGFAAGLGALHGAIFVILVSEQSALLMGSLLLFALLASVMLGTRKVDWDALLR